MFYERLKFLCEQNETTITAFTRDVLKMSKGNATNWKNGSEPSLDVLRQIADYFNVSTDYLLGKTDEPKPIDEVHDEVDEYLDILHKRGDMRMLFSVAKDATREDVELAAKIIEDIIKRQRGEE